MPRLFRIATLFAALSLILTACASSEAQATAPNPTTALAPSAAPAPTAAPTSTPAPTAAPTAVPTLAKGVLVAGVDVGGLTNADARTKLEGALQPLLLPIELQAGATSTTLKPEQIGLELPLDAMLTAAQAAQPGARIDLQVTYNQAKLHEALEGMGTQSDQPAAISVISDTKAISRSFALAGGAMTVDVEAATKLIDERLRAVGGARRITLPLMASDSATARPTPAQLQEQVELLTKNWKGTAGVYVYDLASGAQIAGLNEKTAFTAASTIKVAIMLNLFMNVPKFNARQTAALKKMIVESDNLKANDLLAAAAGGTSTESAFEGANQMSAMLADLGLKNTFLYVPFESGDFIKLYKTKFKTGPAKGGEAPFIKSSNTLRTTPFEMAQIYINLEQCSEGKGVLLEKYGENLSAARCKEMIAWLETNGDHTRMLSGLPKDAKVAHKSGWIPPEIQADVGIVRSPGGDFVIAIYMYQPGERYPDSAVKNLLGSVARLTYSYYNPVVAGK
jgi:beta-lactamase class A